MDLVPAPPVVPHCRMPEPAPSAPAAGPRLSPQHRSWFPDLMLALATAIWGASFAVIKTGVAEIDPLVFLALRFGGGALVYMVFFHRRAWPTRTEIVWGLYLGALLWSGNILQTVGLTEISPARSAFLTSLNVLGVPFLLMIFWKQRVSLGVWMSVLLACAGLVVLYWTHAGMSMQRGDLLTLGCAAIFSGHILVMSSAGKRGRPLPLCGVQLVSAGIAMCALLPVGLHGTPFREVLLQVSPATWWGLGWLATFGTVLPFALQATYQPRTTPTRAAVMFTLEPVFATAFAAILIGTTLSPRDAVGCGLLLLAVAVAEFKR